MSSASNSLLQDQQCDAELLQTRFSSSFTFLFPRQSVVSGVTTAYNREQLWLANETLIAKLQARCRGFLVRDGLKKRMDFLRSQDPAVTCIQVRSGPVTVLNTWSETGKHQNIIEPQRARSEVII